MKLEQEKQTVLIVEDSRELWRSLARSIRFSQMDVQVECASSYLEAIEVLNRVRPAVIICDYFLPDFRNGLEVWKYCRGKCPEVPFLLISGMPADQFLRHVAGLPSHPAFLSKPFSTSEFTAAVNGLLSSREAA